MALAILESKFSPPREALAPVKLLLDRLHSTAESLAKQAVRELRSTKETVISELSAARESVARELSVRFGSNWDSKSQSGTTVSTARDWEPRLAEEMNTWHVNPLWRDDPPELEVSVPEGSFCRMDAAFSIGLPPDAVFSILCDPENGRVFKNLRAVKRRVVRFDDGNRQEVELEQAAAWKFLFLSGTFDVALNVIQDREARQIRFSLAKPGFMRAFEGGWDVLPLPAPLSPSDPIQVEERGNADAASLFTFSPWRSSKPRPIPSRVASSVKLRQNVMPAMVPPSFLGNYLRGITAQVTKDMLRDLQLEAARIRHRLPVDADVAKELAEAAKVSQEQHLLGNSKIGQESEKRRSRDVGHASDARRARRGKRRGGKTTGAGRKAA